MTAVQVYDHNLRAWRQPRQRSLDSLEAALAEVCGAVAAACAPFMRGPARPMGWVTDSVAIILSERSATFPCDRFYSRSHRKECGRA